MNNKTNRLLRNKRRAFRLDIVQCGTFDVNSEYVEISVSNLSNRDYYLNKVLFGKTAVS